MENKQMDVFSYQRANTPCTPLIHVPVSEHPGALVLPQVHEHRLRVDHGVDRADHAQPDAAEVAQVEDVMELGRGRQHLGLRLQPQLPGEGYQSFGQGADL